MKEAFIDWNPGTKTTKALLASATAVVDEYRAQGYALTLRQLYYQLVARDIIPNKQSWYNRLGELVKNARLAGFIDWGAIEDRGRVPKMPAHWSGPDGVISAAIYGYRLDRWAGQEYRVEVWCEKDALSSVIEPVCNRWHVCMMANRGYSSSSAMYDAAKRFEEVSADGVTPVVIYLGDHDPSGLDMSRDIDDRLDLMTYGEPPIVKRIALNYDQVEEYSPPPNPTKLTDSRAGGYIADYGYDSWELDALEPRVIDDLISDTISQYIDLDLFEGVQDQEEKDKETLRRIARELRREREINESLEEG